MEKKRVKGRFVAAEKVEAVESVVGEKVPRRPRAKFCREYTRKRLAEVIPKIVECFIYEAMQGSVPHAKALVSLGGLDKAHLEEAKPRRRGKGLAALLLARLKPRTGTAKTTTDAEGAEIGRGRREVP